MSSLSLADVVHPKGTPWILLSEAGPRQLGFPGGIVVGSLPASAGDTRDVGSIPGLGRSPGVGNGNQCLIFLPGKSHGQRSLGSMAHGVTKNQM